MYDIQGGNIAGGLLRYKILYLLETIPSQGILAKSMG